MEKCCTYDDRYKYVFREEILRITGPINISRLHPRGIEIWSTCID